MHVYCSALGFAVEDSLLQHYRQLYKEKCPRVVIIHRNESSVSIRGFSQLFEVSPDGLLVATVARDFTIELWLSSTGEAHEWRFIGHQADVTSLAFSADGQLLVSGSIDGQIRTWNVVTGIQTHLMGNVGTVAWVKFSCDGLSLLSISHDTGGKNRNILRVWNLLAAPKGQEPSVRFKCTEPFTVATFSSDSRRIAAATDEGLFEVRSTLDGSLVSTGTAAIQPFNIVLSSDGELLAISNNVEIQLWHVRDPPVQVADVATPTGGSRYSLYLSHNGEYLIYGSSVWRIRTLPPSTWSGLRLPQCLERYVRGPESLLSYKCGWISCAHPQGPLVAIPTHYGINSHTPYRTHGSKIVFATEDGKLVVIDCCSLIS
jgi:WD40 repeat protein